MQTERTEDGGGHGHSLGDVVGGDSQGEGQAEAGAAQARDVHRDALRDVVRRDADGGEDAGGPQALLVALLAVVRALTVLLLADDLVRELGLRDERGEVVEDGDADEDLRGKGEGGSGASHILAEQGEKRT